ncbi:hypothetical protein Asulf_00318 [Archaeoglobus sulfaticallidus PM70-1]|uniref:Uncharacterized protein n=1 Tax=Archaeoglobus sulfaticallidus PM70-1 TaxID=387631 RepID=N0BJM5_9EURY|nr:hypothetical protein [Archaeoglobus sulfaticallidus]AGK60350.1 hypothetical protein Asulf_00318 [Archaeoglobus sulfaticallidus PM70-1]
MIKSYQIVFGDVKNPEFMDALRRCLYKEGLDYDITMRKLFGRTVLIIRIRTGEKCCKKIFVSLTPPSYESSDIYINGFFDDRVYSSKNVFCVDARKIARKFECGEEYPMLGALARLGIYSLATIISEIYRSHNRIDAHKRVLAIKEGFKAIKTPV